jgi:hypothetical protein
MKKRAVVLLLAVVCSITSLPLFLSAQGCGDDEAMVESYRKDIADLVDTVKKEDLQQFEKTYHQRSCLTKLSLCLSLVDELLYCLDKAGQDPAATPQQTEEIKAKRELYAKFRDKIEDDHKVLKAAQTAKDAKAVIEEFDLSP